jgi:hypothetical protein
MCYIPPNSNRLTVAVTRPSRAGNEGALRLNRVIAGFAGSDVDNLIE